MTDTTDTCTLCDLPIRGDPVTADDDADETFCCRGCREVYRTLGDADPESVSADDLDAARDGDGSENDVPEDAATAFLAVDGMHCTACEAFLETTARDGDGVYDAEASYTTEMLKVTYDDSVTDEGTLAESVSRLGYRASVPEVGTAAAEEERFGRDELRTVLGVLGAMAVMMIYVLFVYPTYLGIYPESFLYEPATHVMVFVPIPLLSTFVVFFVGYPIIRSAYVSLRAGTPSMDVLIAGGALASYAYSMYVVGTGGVVIYFDVAVAIVAVVTLGDFVQRRVKRRALGSIGDLDFGRVTTALVRDAAGTHEVDVDDLEPGDEVVVKRGERVPLDGTIVEGEAALDEALVTGESVPEAKGPGDSVIGGSVATDGRLVVRVGERAASTYDRLLGQLWNVQSGSGGTQRLADTIAALFVPFVLALALLVAAGWLLTGAPVREALTVGVSVLVVSCPCSFGLATPVAVAAGVSRAADDGVLVTNTDAVASLADVDVVAFDKTGTLTEGKMRVTDAAVDDAAERDVLRYAAAIEREANHPVADAVVGHAAERGALAAGGRGADDAAGDENGAASDGGRPSVVGESPDADGDASAATDESPALRVADFEERRRGAVGTVDGARVLVGHPDLFAGDDWTVPDAVSRAVAGAQGDGAIATVVGWDGRARGVLAARDTPREDWTETVEALARDGREVVVVTGDDQSRVAAFESHPDVADVFAGVLPQAKAAVVERLRGAEGTVAMVGDGTNDAPALAAADLGVAFASGTELATEAADATITRGGLRSVRRLFGIATTTRSRVRQNFGWALGYNAITLPLAALGLVDPLLAALAMAASSLLVVANSARSYALDE
ncbi:Cu2+-exporting ATPase [Halarchaeum rubridurum]|uniref:Cu2+-exporting ATPase n=1 Tax=Halarchaeum rubridurum TaxID=489911 RepID=A0A830G2W0_9EURY|nr:cation-translocating P-type ATPase [Halarchaeum rubridurum]MBP1955537.1 Cu2+-exporting ATPase [Halarchaeum rubridurum]GGM73173.1 heavy metal translocating P-type ATPase [Halarchaeum rubridurum]